MAEKDEALKHSTMWTNLTGMWGTDWEQLLPPHHTLQRTLAVVIQIQKAALFLVGNDKCIYAGRPFTFYCALRSARETFSPPLTPAEIVVRLFILKILYKHKPVCSCGRHRLC